MVVDADADAEADAEAVVVAAVVDGAADAADADVVLALDPFGGAGGGINIPPV